MHYKKIIVLIAILTIPILFVNFTYIKSAGAHPGATGAPNDGSCADATCHTGNVVTNDKIVNSLIFPTPDSSYTPGKTYLVTIKVKKTGIVRFGFEVGALYGTTYKNAGTFALAEASRTQLLSHVVKGDTREEVTHTQAGNSTTTTGSTQWTFNWTAPATNVGVITFYYATNCTNNNQLSTGDNINLSTFKIKPASTNSVDEYLNESELTTFFNSDYNTVDLKYNLKKDCAIKISVLDANGSEIYSDKGEQKPQGQNTDQITLPGTVASGIYFVNLQYGGHQLTKKLFVE
jgi:hypothetical protein